VIQKSARSSEFESLLVANMKVLHSYALKLCRNHHRAEDLVQTTILKALNKHDTFQPGTNIKGWLSTILFNEFLSTLRKEKRVVEDVDGSYAAKLSTKPQQEDAILLADAYARIALLPPEQAEALLAIGELGESYDAVAEDLQVATGTIKSRVSRARATMEIMMQMPIQDIEPEKDESETPDKNVMDEVRRRYADGDSIFQLAREFTLPSDEILVMVDGVKRKKIA